MAKAVTTLSSFDQQLTIYKKQDFQKKVDIAANILKKCQQKEIPKDSRECTHYDISSYLSGVPLDTLIQIDSLTQKTKSFGDWFIEQKRRRYEHGFLYKKIRRELVDNYIHKRTIVYKSEYKNFKKYEKLFTTKKIPGTDSEIVVEIPETVLERRRFLCAKMTHIEANGNIVYVGKANIIPYKGKFSNREDINKGNVLIIAASPTYGHISYIYCCGNQEFLRNWIDEKLIPELPPQSLVVFQENLRSYLGYDDKSIDAHSTKVAMMNWLTLNQIAHDPTMHKADLYKLVNDYKRTCIEESSPAEDYLKAHGHFTLRKNYCNLYDNYFDSFWNLLMQELNIPSSTTSVTGSKTIYEVNKLIQNTPLSFWKDLGDQLEEKEREIYREDLEMEHIIDKLLTMTTYESQNGDGGRIQEYYKKEKEHIFLYDTFK